ncbi:histone-lysine N-methyltransferase SETMAR [Trichonephila clavipes]|nr:histone-lysine N-methyltransferase SETMAR [Trichonephila clavipes]
MITNFFIPELNNHHVQELWFQQDGATCHTARATIDLLKDTFGDRLISRFGPVNWPPRSCDLTPLDYFLWGYVKMSLSERYIVAKVTFICIAPSSSNFRDLKAVFGKSKKFEDRMNEGGEPTSHDKGKNASQVAEIVHGVYGANTVTDNYVQFWFRRFRSVIFDVKDAPRPGRPVVENVDEITERIEVDRHVSSRRIAQELKINHETVLNHLGKVGFKKKLDVRVSHQLTLKNMMDRISICEALAKRNEIDPFLQEMVIGDEKWVTYDSIERKQSWLKRGEVAQTVAKPGLIARKILLCIWWD